MKGKTKSGFEYDVAEERINNYELLEVIGEVDENPLVLPRVIDLLLGEEQKKKLKDHVRAKDGLVPTDKISEEITEIFQSQSEIKNS